MAIDHRHIITLTVTASGSGYPADLFAPSELTIAGGNGELGRCKQVSGIAAARCSDAERDDVLMVNSHLPVHSLRWF